MNQLISFAVFLCLSTSLFAQSKYNVSGYIKDASTGEDLIGVTILVKSLQTGAVTNAYGYYSLELPANGTFTLKYTYLGYVSAEKEIQTTQNQVINISLEPESQELEGVEITVDELAEKVNNTQMGLETLSQKEIKTIPVIFGESDLIKVLQLKPGVKSGGEGSAGLYVRGGGADQNLVLLDEALVYNASHLFGFFSVFNSDAIKNVDLYKSDFPAQYGGRLSSVLDIKLKEGNNKKFTATGGIGLIASRATIEAPIVKDKSSFIISGRRTYFDLITRQINRANEGNEEFNPIPDYYFYDLNAKANYDFSQKDRLFVSGYFGRDVFQFENDNFNFDFDWGNTTATVRWNHVFSPKLFLNTSAIFSDYRYRINSNFSSFDFQISSQVRDLNLKLDFDYLLNDKHSLRFGYHITQHHFTVGRVNFSSDDGRIDFNSGNEFDATEMGIYINDDININARWRLNTGLRISSFANTGKWYYGIEPRVAARYKASPQVSLKASFAQMNQYVQLISNSAAALPTDIWYPSNRVVTPQVSQQASVGASFLLGEGKYLLSNEYYYKWMQNQIDLRDGAQIFINENLDQEFVFGRGWSYGTEIYLEKKEGRTTGWIGYTLSWTKRQFADSSNNNAPINNGKAFFPRYDRRHDISLVIMHQLNDKWTISGTFVYGSGNAVSLPTNRFIFQNFPGTDPITGTEYLERNGFRMPNYHRADINFIRKFKPKWGESELAISIYNVYNRRNAYLIYFEEVKDPQTDETVQFKAKQVALFPILPAITWNFKF